MEDREARQRAIDALWHLRTEGVALRNEDVNRTAEDFYRRVTKFPEWMQRVSQWRSRVLEEAGKANVNLKFYLETLDRMGPPPANVRIVNDEHGRLVCVISEILKRLEEYLKKETVDRNPALLHRKE